MSLRIAPVILIITTLLCSTCGRRTASSNDTRTVEQLPYAVNINSAPAEELQKIPQIGETLAGRIIEHRNINGPFRRVEYLMLVPGISDKRFRKIRPFVRVE